MTDEVLENLKMWSVDPLCVAAAKRIEGDAAEIERLWAALTPNAQTKAAYIGKFTMTLKEVDDYGDDRSLRVTIPWTSIKEIMRAILKYADEQTAEQKP